jgi:ABC-2 type transport system ATP-binding protein
MNCKNIIEVSNLSKSFKGRKVIDKINLIVEEGDIFGFLGPNGSGKTTTIRMLVNLIYPDEGTIKINGCNLKDNFKNAIENVGVIVETPKFHPYLSGRKNLELMANLISDISSDRVDEVLKLAGLISRAGDKVKTYSLGMKQRLGIANALLGNPELVILDEPTNGLDPQGMKEIRDLVCELALKKNITFFISTHLLHEVEQICNKVAILNHGKIVAQGKVDDLLNFDYETVEICTSSNERVLDIIKHLHYVKSAERSVKGIVVHIEKGRSAELNRLLITNDVDIEYLIPLNRSLETFFIDITKGGGEIDKSDVK